MAHLSGFGLENFRVFKEYTWFDFAPITILVGPNSSGKSSLIKALLLMNDNIQQKGRLEKLEVGGALHNLGDLQKTISTGSNSKTVSFICPIAHGKTFVERLCRRYDFIISEDSWINFHQENIVLQDGTTVYTRRDFGKLYLNLPLLISILFKPSSITAYSRIESSQLTIKALRILHQYSAQLLELEEFPEISLWDDYEVSEFGEWPHNRYWVDEEIGFHETPDSQEEFRRIYYEDKLYYLPDSPRETFEENKSIRQYLQKLYPHESFVDEVAEAICVCLRYDPTIRKVAKSGKLLLTQWPNKIDYMPSIKSGTSRVYQVGESFVLNRLINDYKQNLIDNDQRENFLKTWCQKFNLDEIKINRHPNLNINYIDLNGMMLADVGYGYSQLTALLLSIISEGFEDIVEVFDLENSILGTRLREEMINLRFDANSRIMILEEPEANLHPKFQSQLANLINASICNSYVDQFLIETHSEYIIRKFQYLVAKGEMKPEDVVIYYFHDPNDIPKGKKHVKKITILDDGSLSDDFGPGFFDEAANLAMSLFDVRKNRQN